MTAQPARARRARQPGEMSHSGKIPLYELPPALPRVYGATHEADRARTGLWVIGLLAAVCRGGVLGFSRVHADENTGGSPLPRDSSCRTAVLRRALRSIVASKAWRDRRRLEGGYGADPEKQRLCHAITHAIGQAAVRKYSTVAEHCVWRQRGGSGYYHG